MRTTRVLSLLTALALVAPASSSARAIDSRPAVTAPARCYQLNPYVPGQPRGMHQVPCGVGSR
jgi:hypothetical protein